MIYKTQLKKVWALKVKFSYRLNKNWTLKRQKLYVKGSTDQITYRITGVRYHEKPPPTPKKIPRSL